MSQYKLNYFNIKILGEPIRFIFHAAGIEFEDIRMDEKDFSETKQKFKWGVLPILSIGDEEIAESTAIARFLARKYNLAGENDLESAHIDEYVDVCKDIRLEWRKFYFENDEVKKAAAKTNLETTIFPNYLSKLNKIVEANGSTWIVGKKYSWADFFLATFVEVFEDTIDPKLLDKYPALKANKEAVFAIPGIKTYIEGRPKTEI